MYAAQGMKSKWYSFMGDEFMEDNDDDQDSIKVMIIRLMCFMDVKLVWIDCIVLDDTNINHTIDTCTIIMFTNCTISLFVDDYYIIIFIVYIFKLKWNAKFNWCLMPDNIFLNVLILLCCILLDCSGGNKLIPTWINYSYFHGTQCFWIFGI